MQVTCSSPGGSAVSTDVPALQARAERLSAAATVHADGDQVTNTVPANAPAANPAELCTPAVLQLRGLLVPPAAVTCSSGTSACSAHPLDALSRSGLAVPSTYAAAAALSSDQQQSIQAALARYACSAGHTSPAPGGYALACDSDAAATAYLLGPTIASNGDISSAVALAPQPSAGRTSWAVVVRFTSRGQAAWAQYTAAHNTGGVSPPSVLTCGPSTVACADYVAVTLDGLVLSTPVNLEAISGGTLQVSGAFTAASAKRLAGQLADGSLPVPLAVDSVVNVSGH